MMPNRANAIRPYNPYRQVGANGIRPPENKIRILEQNCILKQIKKNE
jgi:hypothetical protein